MRASEPFATLERIGAALMRVPPPEQRTALAEMGVKLTAETFMTPTPRPGPMTVIA